MPLDLPSDFRTGVPSDDYIEEGCTDGLIENSTFHWVERPSLEQCLEVIGLEAKALRMIHEGGGTEQDADWPDDVEFEDEGYGFYLCDCGIASLVVGVQLVGGVTVWSCSAANGHMEEAPTVAFWADRHVAEMIYEHASANGVEMLTSRRASLPDHPDMFVLVSRSGLRAARALATSLMRCHPDAQQPAMADALQHAQRLVDECPLKRD